MPAATLFLRFTFLLGATSALAACSTDTVSLSSYKAGEGLLGPATGSGRVVVWPDLSMSGSVVTTQLISSAACIFDSEKGPRARIIPLQKTAPNEWTVPQGIRLTNDEYERYRQGHLGIVVVGLKEAPYGVGPIWGAIRPRSPAPPKTESPSGAAEAPTEPFEACPEQGGEDISAGTMSDCSRSAAGERASCRPRARSESP